VAKKPSNSASLSADARIVLLKGKELFLRQLYTRMLREEIEKKDGPATIVNFDGAITSAADVLDECRSFGLLAERKIVVVDNAEELIKEATRPMFERYAQGLAEGGDAGATLVLRAGTWRAGKLDAMIEQVGVILECEEPRHADAVLWVRKRAPKEHKTEIEIEAAEHLVERVGCSLGRLDSELGKLAAAAGGKAISLGLVNQFVGLSREEEAWGIQSTLLSASPPQALAHLRYVLDVSRQPAVLVGYAMTDLTRKLHAASRALKQGAPEGSLMKPLKLWPGNAGPIFAAARRLDPDRALEIFRSAVRADQRSKSGLGEADRSLEMLAIEMTRKS